MTITKFNFNRNIQGIIGINNDLLTWTRSISFILVTSNDE